MNILFYYVCSNTILNETSVEMKTETWKRRVQKCTMKNTSFTLDVANIICKEMPWKLEGRDTC